MSLLGDILTIARAAKKQPQKPDEKWAEVIGFTSMEFFTVDIGEHEHIFTSESDFHHGDIKEAYPHWGMSGCFHIRTSCCQRCRVIRNRVVFFSPTPPELFQAAFEAEFTR